MLVEVPRLVAKAKAGQFVIIRVDEHGERVPMSIAGLDRDRGLLTIIYQVVGKTSAQMTTVGPGKELSDVVGPLGIPSHVQNWGTACVIGGGIGIAPIYPIAQAYKQAGNEVITIIGARIRRLSSMSKSTGLLPMNSMSVPTTALMGTTVWFRMS